MRAKKSLPSQADLLDKFDYEPETGVLKLKKCRWKSRIGTPCGILQSNGYVTVSYNGKKYYAHRIIWVMMTGENIDDITIDHKDNNRSNNIWSNLRKASHNQQEHNKPVAKGYHYAHGHFRVRIRINGVYTLVGYYKTKAEARKAYQAKQKELRGEYSYYD